MVVLICLLIQFVCLPLEGATKLPLSWVLAMHVKDLFTEIRLKLRKSTGLNLPNSMKFAQIMEHMCSNKATQFHSNRIVTFVFNNFILIFFS